MDERGEIIVHLTSYKTKRKVLFLSGISFSVAKEKSQLVILEKHPKTLTYLNPIQIAR